MEVPIRHQPPYVGKGYERGHQETLSLMETRSALDALPENGAYLRSVEADGFVLNNQFHEEVGA